MSLVSRLRGSFIAGLVLVAPLAVTVFVLQFVFVRLTGAVDPVVRELGIAAYVGNIQIAAQIATAVLIAVVITALGDLASRQVGRRLFGSLERGLRFVPFVRTIYFGVQQVSESLMERSTGYDRVVLVQYPIEGSYVVGFVTSKAPSAARDAVGAGEPTYTVFLPNSPNPTAGQLLVLRESDLTDVEMSVREGLRLLVTTGLSVEDVADDLPDPRSERGDGPTPAAADTGRG
ncbi:MAG: DUF502 domain-containing protein [Haloferacaceae archaeon]|jgi:uncharacterized membrane protein